MTTSALQVKKAIFDIAKETFPDAFVSWGFNQNFERKNIFLEETVWESSEWGPMGTNKPRNQVINQKVYILYVEPHTTLEECETAATELLDTFETALRDNPTLRGLCISSALVPDRIDVTVIDQGSSCIIEANVRCSMRI